ncbi:MAG: helix-turn-helix domain-containing protein, partial [Alphaproteobacteria bacterium]
AFVLFATLRDAILSRAALQMENLALRQQVAALKRQTPRPRLGFWDRLFWVILFRLWSMWRDVLVIVKPETVIAWHRAGFRLFWRWKSRQKRAGRPPTPKDIRDLIRRMCRENPLWGAPRIHGELLKLGIDVSQATVSRHMLRPRKPPSPTNTPTNTVTQTPTNTPTNT